jgi:hypothetical protein
MNTARSHYHPHSSLSQEEPAMRKLRPNRIFVSFIAHLLLAASLALPLALTPGCGADKDCVELCTEGQAGDCTSIKGDCGAFCSALGNVESPSGCGDARESYQDCLNSESDLCDSSCGLEELTLSQCVASYCAAHAGEADCQTLTAAF